MSEQNMGAVALGRPLRRVMIATPTHSGEVSVFYAHSLMQTLRLCTQQGIDLREVFLPGESILAHARNSLVAIAIRSKVDDMIFIDADQEWSPDWVTSLLRHPVDCVGAPVRKKSDDEGYNVHVPGGVSHIQVDHGLDLWTAQGMAIGTGFLRLSRRALVALWNASEPYRYAPGAEEVHWVFDIRPENGLLVAEDIRLCKKLADLGIPTWVDPSMTCGHVGTKKFTGDFRAWVHGALKQEHPAA